MMVHHENNHRPFKPSKYGGDEGAVVNSGLGAPVTESSRLLLHRPAAIESFISPSSSSSGGMGCPFTQTQWRELERQAMIYKYMVASVPVPPDLLFPLPSSSLQDSHHYSLGPGSYSLRFGNNHGGGGDPEPGRCRRTDGKKWRCSRDAAPDQKYCERHLNRGRPRSRKHVEASPNNNSNKKTRHCHMSSKAPPLPSASPSPSPAPPPPMFAHGTGGFEPVAAPANKEARGYDWLMIGDSHISEDTLSLNSNFNTTKPNQFNEYLLPLGHSDAFSLSSAHRGFIDAWSNSSWKQSSSVSPHDDNKNIEQVSVSDEMDHIQMGLGVTSGSWISSAPGGPLGEVFRTISSPSSPNSGVMQRKVGSASDNSSGGSSSSSMGRSEITVQWFNTSHCT